MNRIVLEGPRASRLRCEVADTRAERTRGLRGHAPLGKDEALWIPHASSVHTFGMRFAITVVRLDRSLRVLDVRIVRPGHLVPPSRRVSSVVECATDVDVRVGDRFRINVG